MDANSEQWAPVIDWPAYEISTHGRVRRDGQNIATFTVRGYPAFNVCDGHLRKSLRVHREMARVFLPNPDTAPIVRHLDGNSSNNQLHNLAWGTAQQNEFDKRTHGRALLGVRHHQHKLTEEQVRAIRKIDAPPKALAACVGVRYETINNIKVGKTWRHLV